MSRWLMLSLFVLIADQATKQLVEANFLVFEQLPVLPFLNLTLVYNEGAAFSFLSDQGGWQRWLFSGLAAAVSVVLTVWLVRLRSGQKWTAAALSLLIGGALGNLVDRLLFGHVIDFIDVFYGRWHWPAFNVADSAIFIGVAMILLETFFPRKTG